jgi:hypothetical protein
MQAKGNSMKTNSAVLMVLLTALSLSASSASSQIRVLDENQIRGLLHHLPEIDFEDLPYDHISFPPIPPLPNPLKLDGVTFTDLYTLRAGLCTSPSCEPDPDNAYLGANIVLSLNPGATISFDDVHRIVVLDIQGMGENPFTLLFTDKQGHQITVESQGVPYGVTLIGVSARAGVENIRIQRVGGTLGPLGLARILFSKAH